MHALYHILARIRESVISLKQKGLGALDVEIKQVESQIQSLEVNDSNNHGVDFDLFRNLHNKYRALLRQHHSRWAQ